MHAHLYVIPLSALYDVYSLSVEFLENFRLFPEILCAVINLLMAGRGRRKGRRSKTCIGRKFKTKPSKQLLITGSEESVCLIYVK